MKRVPCSVDSPTITYQCWSRLIQPWRIKSLWRNSTAWKEPSWSPFRFNQITAALASDSTSYLEEHKEEYKQIYLHARLCTRFSTKNLHKKSGLKARLTYLRGFIKIPIHQSDLTSIFLGFALSTFGSTSLRTPSFMEAVILS